MQVLLSKDTSIDRSIKKRAFDLFFASFFVLLSLPFLFLIPLLIKLTSSGPVLYRSKRIGRGGRVISCLKFRSMYADAQERLDEILKQDRKKKIEWKQTFKLKKDPRITPLGRFLRKTSLDELPQFFNVLMGDLSIVGPRPITYPEHLKISTRIRSQILQVKPGVTGLWQTSGRNDLTWKRRVALELNYVKHRSFFLDLYLIVKTIPAMLFSKGAY